MVRSRAIEANMQLTLQTDETLLWQFPGQASNVELFACLDILYTPIVVPSHIRLFTTC
jgi:hypothetical protein